MAVDNAQTALYLFTKFRSLANFVAAIDSGGRVYEKIMLTMWMNSPSFQANFRGILQNKLPILHNFWEFSAGKSTLDVQLDFICFY